MEEDQIIESAKKEANDLWEKELKEDFNTHIQNCVVEALKELKGELNKFEKSMEAHMNSLDEKFEKKFKENVSLIKEQLKNNDKSNIKI